MDVTWNAQDAFQDAFHNLELPEDGAAKLPSPLRKVFQSTLTAGHSIEEMMEMRLKESDENVRRKEEQMLEEAAKVGVQKLAKRVRVLNLFCVRV